MLLVTLNVRIGKSIQAVEQFTVQVIRLAESVERISNPIEDGKVSTTYIALHNGNKVSHTVTSTQNDGESDADFTARHFAAVSYDQANGWPIAH